MWHSRFFGTVLAVLMLSGFIGSQSALAAYPISDFSISQPPAAHSLNGSFQLAVMGNSAVPLDIPLEKTPEKVQPAKPAVEQSKVTPKVTQKVAKPNPTVPKPVKKASKPKQKKVKKANVKKAPAAKPVEEEGFFTKTLKSLVGGDDDKKDTASSKSLVQKTAVKKPEKKEEGMLTKTLKTLVGDDEKKTAIPTTKAQKTGVKSAEPEKKEEGLLTKTLKTLVGGDKKDKKAEKTAKKDALNPIDIVPTGSKKTKKKGKEQPKTAMSETKKTLKDSFEKLIGVGAVDEKAIEEKSKAAKQATKQAKAVKKVEKKVAPKPKRITARKYIESEADQLEKDRGGTKKGKNVLKDSFEKLISEDDKKKAATKE
jgi:hypothetical protein